MFLEHGGVTCLHILHVSINRPSLRVRVDHNTPHLIRPREPGTPGAPLTPWPGVDGLPEARAPEAVAGTIPRCRWPIREASLRPLPREVPHRRETAGALGAPRHTVAPRRGAQAPPVGWAAQRAPVRVSPEVHSHLLPKVRKEIQDVPELVGEAAGRGARPDAMAEGGKKLREEGTQLLHASRCPGAGERPHFALDSRKQLKAEVTVIVVLGRAGTRRAWVRWPWPRPNGTTRARAAPRGNSRWRTRGGTRPAKGPGTRVGRLANPHPPQAIPGGAPLPMR